MFFEFCLLLTLVACLCACLCFLPFSVYMLSLLHVASYVLFNVFLLISGVWFSVLFVYCGRVRPRQDATRPNKTDYVNGKSFSSLLRQLGSSFANSSHGRDTAHNNHHNASVSSVYANN